MSLKETAICVIDEEGTIIREGSVPSEAEDIAAWLSADAAPTEKVGLEIGGISRWLHIELMKLGLPSVCIDPRRLRGGAQACRRDASSTADYGTGLGGGPSIQAPSCDLVMSMGAQATDIHRTR